MLPQIFHFRPSRWLAILLIASHVLVVASLPVLDFPLWELVALTLLLNLSYLLWREAGLRARDCCRSLSVLGGDVELVLRNGKTVRVQPCADTVVTPWLTVLQLRAEPTGARYRLVILPDSMDTEDFRRLRVWLKWGYGRA